jgi:hypothetical protein
MNIDYHYADIFAITPLVSILILADYARRPRRAAARLTLLRRRRHY